MPKRTNPTPSRAIKDEFIECRRYQHAWKAYDVEVDGRVYVESTICRRCKTIRKQRIEISTGNYVGGSTYSYPEGYVVPGGRLTETERGALRLINARRTVANKRFK